MGNLSVFSPKSCAFFSCIQWWSWEGIELLSFIVLCIRNANMGGLWAHFTVRQRWKPISGLLSSEGLHPYRTPQPWNAKFAWNRNGIGTGAMEERRFVFAPPSPLLFFAWRNMTSALSVQGSFNTPSSHSFFFKTATGMEFLLQALF